MRAHQATDRGVREQIIVGLPAEQAGDRGKGQFLGQQTGPFLERAGDDDAVVRRQGGVAGHHVGLRLRMGTDLAGKREGAEATRDTDGFMSVGVDHLRGKNAGGACPPAQHR